MSYLMHKPAWLGLVGEVMVVSPAARLEVADWWDAWRLMWLVIGHAVSGNGTKWERTWP